MKRIFIMMFGVLLISTMFNSVLCYAYTQDDIEDAYSEGHYEGYQEALQDYQEAIKIGQGIINDKEYTETYREAYEKGYAAAQAEYEKLASEEKINLKTIALVVVIIVGALYFFLAFR